MAPKATEVIDSNELELDAASWLRPLPTLQNRIANLAIKRREIASEIVKLCGIRRCAGESTAETGGCLPVLPLWVSLGPLCGGVCFRCVRLGSHSVSPGTGYEVYGGRRDATLSVAGKLSLPVERDLFFTADRLSMHSSRALISDYRPVCECGVPELLRSWPRGSR